jgi:hypothetical protein
VEDVVSRVTQIVQAVRALSHNPLIGRAMRGGNGELVIGQGSYGSVGPTGSWRESTVFHPGDPGP